MSNLIDDLIRVRDDSVKLLKSLKGLIVVVEPFVDKTKIVDSLDAVSFYTNGFKEELFGAVEVLLVVEAVTLVNQGL